VYLLFKQLEHQVLATGQLGFVFRLIVLACSPGSNWTRRHVSPACEHPVAAFITSLINLIPACSSCCLHGFQIVLLAVILLHPEKKT
jgi:hypothetical protein